MHAASRKRVIFATILLELGLIHRSAWKANSAKFTYEILHSPGSRRPKTAR
jgi:hypothetical protein